MKTSAGLESSPAPRLPGAPARAVLALALVTTVLVGLTACGYHLLGTGGALPPTVKVVAVLPFERQVPVLQLDQRVTEAMTREMSQRLRVKVQSTKDGADAVLSGVITGFNVAPMSYDAAGRANRYNVTMAAKVRLVDKDGKVLFESQGYRFSEVYERSAFPGNYFSEEVVAYDVVARDFSRALVATMMEAGPGGK